MCAGRRPAAAADDVDEPLVHEAGEVRRDLLRRLRVRAVAVREARRWDSRTSSVFASPESVRMWSAMNSGPVAQFSPTERSGACMIDA